MQLRPAVASRFAPNTGDVIINWGNSTLPHWYREGRGSRYHGGTIINHPSAVAIASNKLQTFNILSNQDVSTPDWTFTQETAQQWVEEGHRVYGRQTLTGHSGQGIILFNPGDTVTPCPLYTKNTKAKYEYRVHVMAGEILDIQQKKKRESYEGGIPGIRNHANGWVFCRSGISVPECVQQQAMLAVQALGLDFGAVDIGYRESTDMAFVYEVNTAPGLEGTTLTNYVTAIKRNFLT